MVWAPWPLRLELKDHLSPPLTSSAGLDEEQFRLPPQTRAVGAVEIADHLLHWNALPVRPNDGSRNLDVVALEEPGDPQERPHQGREALKEQVAEAVESYNLA